MDNVFYTICSTKKQMCLEEIQRTNHVNITVVHDVPASDLKCIFMALLASSMQCQGSETLFTWDQEQPGSL